MRPVHSEPVAEHRPAPGRAGRCGRVRQRLRSVRGVPQPAVRPREHLAVRPLRVPGALHRGPARRPVAGGRRLAPERRAERDGRAGADAARRRPGVLRRQIGRPAGRDRRGHPAPGGHHAGADPAREAGRRPVRVRAAARPGRARQSASDRHPPAREPRRRHVAPQAAAGFAGRLRPPAGRAARRLNPGSAGFCRPAAGVGRQAGAGRDRDTQRRP